MTDRIPLDHLTSAQYDQLYERLEQAELHADPELHARLTAALAVLGKAETELGALRQVARGYCPECGRGDAAPTVTDWERERDRAVEAEQRLRNIANGSPHADAIQAEIGEMIAQTHELRDQLRHAEADVSRVISLYERWVKAGPPPLGTSMSRWWDKRLAELHTALNPKES